jgi:hypothetical protein
MCLGGVWLDGIYARMLWLRRNIEHKNHAMEVIVSNVLARIILGTCIREVS